MSLSRMLISLNRQRLVFWLVAVLLAWASIDYALLFRQMESMQPVQDAKPMRKADVGSSEGFVQDLGFIVDQPNHVSFNEPHVWVPGNGAYFIMITTGAVELSLCSIETNFVARRLHIKSLDTGKNLKQNGASFSIPVGEDIYRIYLHDPALTLGKVVSLTTLVVCGVLLFGHNVPGIATVLTKLRNKKRWRTGQ